MSRAFTAIELEQLPAPTVVENLSFEAIFSEMLADLQTRDPIFTALLESDPAYKILEVAAYRELLIRQRINDAARQTMLAYATSSNLDQIGARYGVARRAGETDDSLRRQIQLSFEAYTTAGSEGSYVFHTLRASLQVKDVAVSSPLPGDVMVHVLSTDADGIPSAALLQAVTDTLTSEDVRPLTDRVTILPAEIRFFRVAATLHLYRGPDPDIVKSAAYSALNAYVSSVHLLGGEAALSGIYAALHQPGVRFVELSSPTESITCTDSQAPYCTAVTIEALVE